jgi:hypothetical protein
VKLIRKFALEIRPLSLQAHVESSGSSNKRNCSEHLKLLYAKLVALKEQLQEPRDSTCDEP